MKKSLALILTLMFVVSLCVVGVSAQQTDDENGEALYYKGAFYYRPGTGEYDPGTENVDVYTYSDEYFRKSAKEFDPHLATLSFALAVASVSSTREPFTPEGYQNKGRNGVAFLEDTGFSDISLNADYHIKPTKNTMGVACAHKRIVQDGKEYTLVVILPRSAGYEAEWGDNFVLGAEGNAKGFDTNALKCLDFAKDYISEQEISGDIKVWTTGYSRGASVTNLIAGKLIDDPNKYLGDDISLTPENIYAYTCGTPSAVSVENDPRNEKYSGIFNSYLETELASAMAPADMGFTRYGTDRILYNAENYDKMLANLKICNDYVYSTYSTSINSNLYHPKKLGFTNGSIGLADDNNSYIPDDPAEYLRGLCTYLTVLTGGREEYSKTYEQAFSDIIAFYESTTSEQSAALVDSVKNNDDSIYLVAAMYSYFMRLKSTSTVAYSDDQLYGKAKELAAIGANNDDLTSTGIDASVISKVAVKLGRYMLMKPDDIKSIAADYLSSVLSKGMKAAGATTAEIRAITNKKSSEALVHIISHLLLGNIWQSSEVHPMRLDNEQIKAAATLIGNAANLFVDHANEIIIAWLKLDDSNYDDFTYLTDAQYAGYRRVYLGLSNENAEINGDVLDENGDSVASVRDGVLVSAVDKWIGYTTTDDGGFLRIPADKDYQIKLISDKSTDLSVEIKEYSVYDAKATEVFNDTVKTYSTMPLFVNLPAMTYNYAIPSGVEYSVTYSQDKISAVYGDVDFDGEVDIVDVSWIQRYDAGMLELPYLAMVTGNINYDDAVDITDAAIIQRWISGMSVPYGNIGQPMADPKM